MAAQQPPTGPDFALGLAASDLPDGATIAGRVAETPILLSLRAGRYFAVEGACTHYGASLSEGLVCGDRVRCPWHHAAFDLRTGAPTAPAFARLRTWSVEVRDGRIFVREPQDESKVASTAHTQPGRVVIVGGGAAGFAAADTLRHSGFTGELIMLSSDAEPPYDRPNLSKDYLAGTAPEEWIPLKDAAYYRDNRIDLRLNTQVVALDCRERTVRTQSGEALKFDAALLATGAAPVRLAQPGFELSNVYMLRSLADARAIIARAAAGSRAAVIGAGFIGLETAAALVTRGLEVHLIAPDRNPLERILGAEIGAWVRRLHESRGVRFHLERTAQSFDGRRLLLDNEAEIDVDFVVQGVGVRPNLQLAAEAGLDIDNGVSVDARMRTSAPGIYAAGDIARYRDPRTGAPIRTEHWVAAQRQGQIAACNILGEPATLTDAPFFWSAHYDRTIRYVGHAEQWDRIDIDGSIENADFTARYFRRGQFLAAASLGQDRQNLSIHEELNTEAVAAA